MKKRKTYEVSVINKTYSKTYSNETKFYTSDTALELNFQLKEVEYDFDSAEIILLNVDDRSLVTRPVAKSAEGFTYELEDDIVEHYGEWKGQLKFNEGGEIYVSSPVIFRIENDLNNDRPPKLTEVNTWKNLREFADKLISDLQIEQDETLGFLENRQDTVESKFDLLQQEMTDKDVISAPEIIAARGGEPTLSVRLDKEHQEVTAQLAQIVQQKINKIPASFLKKVKNRVHSPEGFSWTDAPIKIYQNQLGEMSTDFNASDHQHIGAGKTYYVDPINGNDLNDGLTISNALKSIYIARGKADVDIIMLADGVYTDVSGFNNSSGEITSNQKNLSIKAIDGAKPIVTTGRNNLTFSLTSGKTKTYQASRTQVVDVLDLNKVDIYGDPQQLKRVNSIDDVESTKGSYYYASPILYVHTFDDRAPDDKVIALMNLYNFRIVGDYKTYFENITFLGGKEGCVSGAVSSATDSTLIIAKNCEFKYSTDGSGGLMTYGADSYLQNCIAARNKKDGFNYHRNMNHRVNYAIEVDCTGRHNGIGGGTDQDNGSTMHDGGKVIRVNGVYFGNEGPNVHEVTTGTESWNLGCQSFGSLAISLLRNANYQMESGKMWLDSCIGYDSNRALVAGSNSTFLLRNSVFDDGDVIVNTGNNATLGEY